MEFNTRVLRIFDLQKKYKNYFIDTELDIFIEMFEAYVKDEFEYPHTVYIKNGNIIKGGELVYMYENLNKIFINKDTLNVHLNSTSNNSYCFETIHEDLSNVIFDREKLFEKENNYRNLTEEYKKDWEKNKHLHWELDRKKDSFKLEGNIKILRDIVTNMISNKVIIVELYE